MFYDLLVSWFLGSLVGIKLKIDNKLKIIYTFIEL
jgi:hypothetical protein